MEKRRKIWPSSSKFRTYVSKIKNLNVIIKKGGKGKTRWWNSSFGLDYQWETVSRHLHSIPQNIDCVWSVLGGGVISARLCQEKEIAAALLWHTKSVNAVNIIAKKCFFRTPTPVCRRQVWSLYWDSVFVVEIWNFIYLIQMYLQNCKVRLNTSWV